jgi:hypothetical protein
MSADAAEPIGTAGPMGRAARGGTDDVNRARPERLAEPAPTADAVPADPPLETRQGPRLVQAETRRPGALATPPTVPPPRETRPTAPATPPTVPPPRETRPTAPPPGEPRPSALATPPTVPPPRETRPIAPLPSPAPRTSASAQRQVSDNARTTVVPGIPADTSHEEAAELPLGSWRVGLCGLGAGLGWPGGPGHVLVVDR